MKCTPLKSATDTISVAEYPNTPPPLEISFYSNPDTQGWIRLPAEPPAQNLVGAESKQAPRGLQEVWVWETIEQRNPGSSSQPSTRGFECLLSWQLLALTHLEVFFKAADLKGFQLLWLVYICILLNQSGIKD